MAQKKSGEKKKKREKIKIAQKKWKKERNETIWKIKFKI